MKERDARKLKELKRVGNDEIDEEQSQSQFQFQYYQESIECIKKWKRMKIPITRIFLEGDVNSRSIRKPHLNKCRIATPNHFHRFPVAYHSKQDRYYIIDGQHTYQVLLERMKDGTIKKRKKIKCCVALDDSGKILDASDSYNREICRNHSYTVNSPSENPSAINQVYLIFRNGMAFASRNKINVDTQNGKELMFNHLEQSKFGTQKLSRRSIKACFNLGDKLMKTGKMEQAQEERWPKKKMMKETSKQKSNKPLNNSCVKTYEMEDEWMSKNNNNPRYWYKMRKLSEGNDEW